jgi:hypothetical protein
VYNRDPKQRFEIEQRSEHNLIHARQQSSSGCTYLILRRTGVAASAHAALQADRPLWAETVDLAGGWFSTWVELGLGEHRK